MNRRRAWRVLTLAVAGLWLSEPSALRAQPKTAARLEEINQRVERESKALSETSARMGELEQQRQSYEKQVQDLYLKLPEIEEELEGIRTEREGIDREIARLEVEIKRVADLYRRRLRALYMKGEGDVLLRLMTEGKAGGLDRNAYYLGRLRQHDRKLIEMNLRLRRDKESKKARLDELLTKHTALKQDLLGERSRLDTLINEQQALLSSVKAEKAKKEGILAELKAQAVQVEGIVASLTSGKEAESPDSAEKSEGPRPDGGAKPQALPEYAGKGLLGFTTDLVFPVRGNLVRKFGKYKVGEFADFVFSKGVEIASPSRSGVRTITVGRVMYAGRMPGYGSMVIVDHGERYYSLYGCLGETLVRVGDELASGQVIARTGELDKKGRNLYFEIRKNGTPMNPQGFYPQPLEVMVKAG
jgi:murein hydrolase activator